MRPTALLLACAAVAASEFTPQDFLDLRLLGGNAAGINEARLHGIAPGAPGSTSDQHVGISPRSGAHAALDAVWGTVPWGGIGGAVNLELAYDQHTGRIRDYTGSSAVFDARGHAYLHALSLAAAPLLVLRADLRDQLDWPQDALQIELGPVIGAGGAAATLGGNKASATGLYVKRGARCDLVVTGGGGLQLVLGAAYEAATARVAFDDARRCTFETEGWLGRAGLGWRF